MKFLYLIRHAKSSLDFDWDNDFERTLDKRGKQEAMLMAEKLFNKKVAINTIVSSTAIRALTTAHFFATAYGINENAIIKIPELYHASANTLYYLIKKFDDALNHVAVFSHNPGLTEFVNNLTDKIIPGMSTCGVFALVIHTTEWKNFEQAEKDFLFYDYPNNA